MPSDTGVKSLMGDHQRAAVLTHRVLKCPSCGEQHIDKGKWATFNHAKHRCERCGRFFPDQDGPSVGVARLDA